VFGNVVHDDIEAGLSADLRDAAAHLSGADYTDLVDCKRHFLIPQRWAPATQPT